ncbi:MAG: ABC transporter substrate-binding protein [Oscillospiraceae bacterium]|nr:ABC transporter substrate-binding protein [Oscillospiraceae bacterium]
MKRLFCIVLLIFVFFLLSGCFDFYPEVVVSPFPSPSPSPIVLPSPVPRVLTFGIAFSPVDVFRPLTDTLRYNSHAARLCYEGLFELDERFIPRPLLCVSMETDDNIRFTLTLREDVVFHNGSPLTAADVAASIQLAQRPGGPYASRLACISSVSAQSDGTILITMNNPVWNAAALFDFPIVHQADGVEVGTGPYRMTLTPEGGFLLPSDNWWQEKQLPAGRIELVPIGNADDLVYSFQYGYISMMQIDPWDTFSPGIHIGVDKIITPSCLMQYIGINTQKAPLNNAGLRRALTLALDREAVIETVYGEEATSSSLPVPPSSPFYPSNASGLDDPGEAAGLGNVPELTLIVGAENTARIQMAEICAEMLGAAGFTVHVTPLGRPAFERALADGDYDLYYAEARLAPNFDPREFLLPGGAFAFGISENAALRSALDDMARTNPYTEEGLEALGLVWDVFWEETPMIPICFRNTLFISQRGLLSGQTPAFSNPYAGFADWTVHDR